MNTYQSPMDHLRRTVHTSPSIHLPILFVEISRWVRDVPMNLNVDLVTRTLGYMTWWYDMLSRWCKLRCFQLFFGFFEDRRKIADEYVEQKKSSCNRHRWCSSGSNDRLIDSSQEKTLKWKFQWYLLVFQNVASLEGTWVFFLVKPQTVRLAVLMNRI